MRKFKFRLQTLEKHRKEREQERRVQLSEAIGGIKSTEQKIFDLDQSIVDARKSYAAMGETGTGNSLQAGDFWVLDAFAQGQLHRRAELEKHLQDQEQGLQEVFQNYVHARKEYQVIKSLHERDQSEFRKKEQKRENKQLDDLYTMRDRMRKLSHTDEGEGDE